MTLPHDRPDLSAVRGHAIDEALDDLRHLDQFHTRDVVEHRAVRRAHQEATTGPDFGQLVHAYLERHAFSLGLRGPLPGHPTLGERWAWQVDP